MKGSTRQYDTINLEGDFLANKISQDYRTFRASVSSYFDNIKELIEYLYAESTRTTANSGKGGDGTGWSHSTHTPILKYIRRNLVSQYMRYLFSSRRWLDLEDGTMEDLSLENLDKIEGYLSTKHRQSNFRTIVKEMIEDDLCIHGVMFGRVDWVAEKNIETKSGRLHKGYTGPKVSRIRPEDIAFNLRATSFEDTPKIVRYVKSMGDLLQEMEDYPTMGWSEEAINKAKQNRLHARGGKQFEQEDEVFRLSKEGFNTWDEYFRSGEVEILEFYGNLYDEETETLYKNYVITVIDRLYVLRAEPLDTWSGKPHIFMATYEKRRDCLWGQGPLETLVGMQYMVNHIRNGVASSMDKILNPKWKQIGEVQLPEDFHAPDAIVRIEEGEGDFIPLIPDTSFIASMPQIDALMREMEMYSGSIDITRGLATPGEQTAFEVSTLNANSSSTFQDTVVNIERDFITPLVQAELELASEYLDVSDSITIIGEEGTKEIMEIERKDLITNGKIVVVGASHFVEKAKRVGDLTNFMNTIAGFEEIKMHVSSINAAKMFEEALDIKDGEVVRAFVGLEEQAEAAKKQQEQIEREEIEAQGNLNDLDNQI